MRRKDLTADKDTHAVYGFSEVLHLLHAALTAGPAPVLSLTKSDGEPRFGDTCPLDLQDELRAIAAQTTGSTPAERICLEEPIPPARIDPFEALPGGCKVRLQKIIYSELLAEACRNAGQTRRARGSVRLQ